MSVEGETLDMMGFRHGLNSITFSRAKGKPQYYC